jgi:hypothetical protein
MREVSIFAVSAPSLKDILQMSFLPRGKEGKFEEERGHLPSSFSFWYYMIPQLKLGTSEGCYNKKVVVIERHPALLAIYIVKFTERTHPSNEYPNYLETTASVISFHV